MFYHGHVRNGVIVLDEQEQLPEGAPVQVQLVGDVASTRPEDVAPTLGEKLLKFAGKAADLPPDAAQNHDHYLCRTGRS